MPPKKMTPPPIDRPLSKAYLRQFSGWSTAFPPGQSEPNSLRVMENMWVDRNGAIAVRPGLRHLSYSETPHLDPLLPRDPGTSMGLVPVGTQELFYTDDGSRALLFAVRETTGKVGFRVILFSGVHQTVHTLSDPAVKFIIPQGEEVIEFDEDTTHVQYLQINNRIIAMSDSGETARLFYVGRQRHAKKLKAVSVPGWEDTHKLSVIHPDAAWIDSQLYTTRTNILMNPSFKVGTRHWIASEHCGINTAHTIPAGTFDDAFLEMRSLPLRTNMQPFPLAVDLGLGTAGWFPDPLYGSPELGVDEDWYMTVTSAPSTGLSLAYSARATEGVKGVEEYRIAFESYSIDMVPVVKVDFYSTDGTAIGIGMRMEVPSLGAGVRYVSPTILTPEGTVSMRLSVGGLPSIDGPGTAGFRNIVLCRADEPTDMFHGDSGTDHFWTGTPGGSASVHHPPQNVSVKSRPMPVKMGGTLFGRADLLVNNVVRTYFLSLRLYDKDQFTPGATIGVTGETSDTLGSMPIMTELTSVPEGQVSADLLFELYGMARGDVVRVSHMMIEPDHVAGIDDYFDGSSQGYQGPFFAISSWEDMFLPNESKSIQKIRTTALPPLVPETPTAETLIATGTAEENPYKAAFFYTFENEVGESAPSKITEVRMHRPWSNWLWKKPNAAGEPAGAETDNDLLCADQLVCTVPQAVYEQALAEGAVRWNLYAIAWSDQDAVPATAQLISQKELYPDPYSDISQGIPYSEGGSIVVTPQRTVGISDVLLPTSAVRWNFSIPPRHINGLVAGDRIILVGSPDNPASIQWSSNRPGEYTNFTPGRGGGEKTLSSGNINLPVSAVLWQNPQSVQTITILCTGDDGLATSYYMAPAKTESSSAGTTPVMGFEETSSTSGTSSPYGCQVLNNALYRPLDRALIKSTAANYTTSHKPMSTLIANVWAELSSKQWIMSAQLDNRLYYLVHNPRGEMLADGCKGNEIWVYDVGSEKGSWSRFLIQGAALKVFKVGTATVLGITRADGIYYLDPSARLDDYVDPFGKVLQRPIPWAMETNTQGANRAHDAWAHLQQMGVLLGNFRGTMEYGLRGWSMNGTEVRVSKIFSDPGSDTLDSQVWDVEDMLLVRRDMKEWYFFAHSLPEQPSSGHIGYVQYRYTPVTVNVGYEYGSVETFEYGRDAAGLGGTNTRSGVPVPMVDYARP